MISPIKTYTTSQIQTSFTEELDIIVKDPKTPKDNIEKIIKEMLKEGGDITPLLTAIPRNLQGRVTRLYDMFTCPALKTGLETKNFLKAALEQALSTLRDERLTRNFTFFCPPYRLPVFKATLNGFFAKSRNEGMDINQAISFASAKALSYLTVSLPTSEHIVKDPDLETRIINDLILEVYQCHIAFDIPIDDSVYLEDTDDKGKIHKHYYHESLIRDWITKNNRDPITNKPRTLEDIKPVDSQTKDFIKNRLIALAYPELAIDPPPSQGINTNSIRFLLLMKVSYSQVIAYSKKFLYGEPNPHIQIAEIERFARDSFSKLGTITAEIKFNWEEIPSECLSFIEMFIHTEGNKAIPTVEAASNLQRKIEIFMTIFSEMQDSRIAPATLDRAGKAIDRGASLERTRVIIQRIDENAIEARFPNCLRGAIEWEIYTGANVEDVSIPEGMLQILEQPSINIESFPEGAKVGETHVLVLIPGKVNEKEFSFEEAETFFSNTEIKGAAITTNVSPTGSNKKKFDGSYWTLIPKGVLKESNSKPYEEQLAMVRSLPNRGREPAAVSRIFELTVAVCLEKIISGADLFTERQQLCEENSDHTIYPWLTPQEKERGICIGMGRAPPPPLRKSYIGVVWRFQPGP